MDYFTKSMIATAVMILLAAAGYLLTPKKPSAFGYKAPRSLKNLDTWNYANNLAKRYFVGVVAVFIVAEIFFYQFGPNHEWAYKRSFWVLIGGSLSVIPFVEIALYRRFDRDGNLRNRAES